MTLQLRAIQEVILNDVNTEIAKGSRDILVQLPTGTGKTITAIAFLMRNLPYPGRALIVGHYTELIDQWYSELTKHMNTPHRIGFMQGSRNDTRADIILGTSQTLCKLERFVEAYKYGAFNYVIYDEGHRSMSASGKRIVKWAMTDPETIVIRLTATPKRTDGVMTSGSQLRPVPLRIPQQLGYLVPEFVTEFLVDANVSADDMIGGSGEYKLGNRIMNQPHINKMIFDKWNAYCRNDKTAIFVSSIYHAACLAKIFLDNGIVTGVVSSKQPAKDNRDTLDKFKDGRIQVLINVNKITEGFDVPDIKTLILARPTKSALVVTQIVGRVLRKHEGKIQGTILHFIPRGGDVISIKEALSKPY